MNKNRSHTLSGKPGIQSLEELEELVGFRASFIEDLARHADEHYDPFPKRASTRPFAKKNISKKVRWINQPINPLKEIQKRIYDSILAQVKLPDYICGGVKEKSVAFNARIHQRNRLLVAIDVRNYFPSIRKCQIYKIWCETLGCSPEVSGILTNLTTYKDYLPQGAPTSTSLANIFLFSIDGPIRAECERLGVSYSVWVDDIAFSGDEARRIIPIAIGTLRRAGLEISRRKVRVIGPGKRKVVTGVVLGSKLSVPSDYKNGLSAGIHKLRTGQIPPEQMEDYVKKLQGGIAYISSINPDLAKKLSKDLEVAEQHIPCWGLR